MSPNQQRAYHRIMKKTTCVLLLILGFLAPAKPQHCGWDHCYVIVVDARDRLTEEVINHLEILLTDSAGIPYTSKWNLENHKETSLYQSTDTLKFAQNTGKNHPKHPVYNIPFGVNCYMLLVYYNNYPDFNRKGTDRLFIKDRNGRYQTTSVSFDAGKITDMCTSNAIWHDKQALDATTITVKLSRKTH